MSDGPYVPFDYGDEHCESANNETDTDSISASQQESDGDGMDNGCFVRGTHPRKPGDAIELLSD